MAVINIGRNYDYETAIEDGNCVLNIKVYIPESIYNRFEEAALTDKLDREWIDDILSPEMDLA